MSNGHLCKAKRIDNGEWIEGYYLPIGDRTYIVCEAETECMDGENTVLYATEWYEVDPSTLCRCTGLKDNNGKLIWENDIVKVQHEKYPKTPDTEFYLFPTAKVYTRNYAVEFINTGSNYGYRCRNRHIHFLITKNVIFNHNVEAIGNIFDNPELLEGGAE